MMCEKRQNLNGDIKITTVKLEVDEIHTDNQRFRLNRGVFFREKSGMKKTENVAEVCFFTGNTLYYYESVR